MQKFIDFYKDYREVVTESLQARVDELVETAVFGSLGEEYIQNKFDEYKSRGVVPSQRLSLKASKRGAERSDKQKEFVDLIEKEYEEILPYVFKMDKDVRDKVIDLAKGDAKKTKKINKFYDKRQVRDVFEDSEQIKNVLSNWFAFRNKKWNSPKSLRNNPTFRELSDAVDADYEKLMDGENSSKDVNSDPDWNMPEGFEFIREVNDLRLYSWKETGDVCEIDPTVKKDWLSIKFDVSGDSSNTWCVGSSNYRDDYGKPDSDGVFKHPFYLVRVKEGDKWVPDVLMHGDSKQIMNRDDVSISEDHFDQIYPVVKGYGQQIYDGTL